MSPDTHVVMPEHEVTLVELPRHGFIGHFHTRNILLLWFTSNKIFCTSFLRLRISTMMT